MLAVDAVIEQEEHLGPVEYLSLDWHDRKRNRYRCTTDSGTELTLQLPRGTVLLDGTVLYNSSERTIIVRAAEESVLAIKPRDALEACRVAHHAGNWHRSLEVSTDMSLFVEADEPFETWLKQSSLSYEKTRRAFHPNLRADAHD